MKRLLCTLVLIAAMAVPALADPKSDVGNAMLALDKASSYHMSIAARGRSVEADFVKPGKMHVTVGPMEIIKIDTDTYVKINGSWKKFAFPGMDQMTDMFAGMIAQAHHTDTDITITDLGMTTLEGAQLHAYSSKNKSGTIAVTIYVDANGYPARLENADGVLKFTNINGPMTIVAPI
jgi:hypothetical protein